MNFGQKANELVKTFTGEISDELPKEIILNRLQEMFKKHIGSDKRVSMPEIYEHVYKETGDKVSQYHYTFRCQRIMMAMTDLRKKTNFFIVGEQFEDYYGWYIVKTKQEGEMYNATLQSRIQGLKTMQKKCEQAVEEEFWKKL